MARQDPNEIPTILHVEDDDNDALLLAKACERAGVRVRLLRVSDGESAKAYLAGRAEYGDRQKNPLPQIIVLDLKMPRVDGFEFLKWLRGEKSFSGLPVWVVTACISADDKARALAEGANSYHVKPTSFEGLVQMAEIFRASLADTPL